MKPLGFDCRPGLLEPVRDQIGLPWNPIVVGREHRVDVSIAQLRAKALPAQEWRITYNDGCHWPFGRPWVGDVGEIKNRVSAFDGLDGLQYRVEFERETILELPLEMADPDGDLRQLVGIGVDLNAVDHVRPHPDVERELPTIHDRKFLENLFFQLVKKVECYVEEVSRAACWIEYAGGIEMGLSELMDRYPCLIQEFCLDGWGLGLIGASDKFAHLGLDLGPSATKRRHEHGLDHPEDGAAVGVMGTQLAALGRVEAALEQGSEDCRLDLAPVKSRDSTQHHELAAVKRNDTVVGEEPTVEPVDLFHAEPPALGHCLEQVPEHRRELFGIGRTGLEDLLEDAAREEPHVLGEQAEQDAIEVVGDAPRFLVASVQRLRERGELSRGVFRDLLDSSSGIESLRVREESTEQLPGVVLGDVGKHELVDLLRGAREVRVDLESCHVADDQEGRVVERLTVA